MPFCANISDSRAEIHSLLKSPARALLFFSAPNAQVSLRFWPLEDFRAGFPLEGFPFLPFPSYSPEFPFSSYVAVAARPFSVIFSAPPPLFPQRRRRSKQNAPFDLP